MLQDAKVVTGTTSGAGRGLGIGALAGVALGTAIGAAVSSNDDCSDSSMCGLTGAAIAAAGLLGGSFVGGLLGSATRIDMWSPAARPGPVTQFSADLMTGDAVRIMGSSHREVGVVVGGSGEYALVRRASGLDTLIDLQSIERYTGNRGRLGKGLLYGAAAGAALGLASYVFEEEDSLYGPPTAGEVVAGTALMSAFGAGIGALVTRKPGQVWTPVERVAESRLSLRPILRRDRMGVIAKLAW
jgi:hypothetical protein